MTTNPTEFLSRTGYRQVAATSAPAEALSGTTLAAGVLYSSLTSLGTIATGVWQGTAVGVAYGGTGHTSFTDGQLLIGNSTGNTLTPATLMAGSGVAIANGHGTITLSATGSGGTVTSVGVSGGTTGLSTTGGPITASGTITLGGTLVAANGGTGVANSGTLTFSGSASVTGSNTGDQTTVSGNAGTATALQTGRTINGVSFDGTTNITVPAAAGTLTGTTLAAGVVASSLTALGLGGSATGILKSTTSTGALSIAVSADFPTLNQDTTGRALPYLVFGDGSDGNLTISSGVTTLAKDTYYNDVTISGTASLYTNGFLLFIAGTLDLTAAPVNAISYRAIPGTSPSINATGISPGIAGVAQTGLTVGGGGSGVDGKAPVAGSAGAQGAGAPVGTALINCGLPGPSGRGGDAILAGGASKTQTSSVAYRLTFRGYTRHFLRGQFLVQGGQGGPSGGSGASTTTVSSGGASGAGGGAGGNVAVFANTIARGGSTAVGAISSTGSVGGNGGTGTGAGAGGGGGGGGSGGSGGGVYIFLKTLTGSTATNAIDVSGGAGGVGGNRTTATAFQGGDGGGNGGTGVISVINAITGQVTVLEPATAGVAGSTQSGGTGGAGAAINVLQSNL